MKELKPLFTFIIILLILATVYQLSLHKTNEETYIKLDIIASTSDLRILADEDKNIYLDTGKGLVPYFKDGKKVNLNDYKEVGNEKEK